MNPEEKTCCILVPAHNEEVSIEDTLRSAALQGKDMYVVDDFSTDRTAEIAGEFASVYTVPENVGKGTALALAVRHFGLTRRYDFVFFLDADTRLATGHIDALIEAAEPDDALLIGRLESDYEKNKTFWGRYRAYSLDVFSWTMKRSTDVLKLVNVLPGVAMLMEAGALAKVDLARAAKYPVEDLVILLDIRQRGLGRLRYVHSTPSAYQVDPYDFRGFLRQTSRWWSGIRQVYDGEGLWRDTRGWTLFNHLNLASWIFSALAPLFWALFLFASWGTPVLTVGLAYSFAVPLILATIYAVSTGRVSVYPLLPLFLLVGWFDAAHFAIRMTGIVKGQTGNRWVSPERRKEV